MAPSEEASRGLGTEAATGWVTTKKLAAWSRRCRGLQGSIAPLPLLRRSRALRAASDVAGSRHRAALDSPRRAALSGAAAVGDVLLQPAAAGAAPPRWDGCRRSSRAAALAAHLPSARTLRSATPPSPPTRLAPPLLVEPRPPSRSLATSPRQSPGCRRGAPSTAPPAAVLSPSLLRSLSLSLASMTHDWMRTTDGTTQHQGQYRVLATSPQPMGIGHLARGSRMPRTPSPPLLICRPDLRRPKGGAELVYRSVHGSMSTVPSQPISWLDPAR
jgi:hypothetical protein